MTSKKKVEGTDALTYDEFVDWALRNAHDSLLRLGSRGLRQAIFDALWLNNRRQEAQGEYKKVKP